MKKYAVVTALTLSTYQTFGYEIGNILTVLDSYERDGVKWFRFIGTDNLPQTCREEFFDMKTVTASDMKSSRLKSALIEFTKCFYESDTSARETMEVLVSNAPGHYEEHIEEVRETLCEFLRNECDPELHELVEWIRPFEEPEEVES